MDIDLPLDAIIAKNKAGHAPGSGPAQPIGAARPAGAARRWTRGQKASIVRAPDEGEEDVPMRDVRTKEDDMSTLPPRTKPRQFPRPAKAMRVGQVGSVCVVGGGPSGLACCRELCRAGLQVTLIQESRGIGGKLCTKYVNGPDDPTLHFDMGVQLLRPAGPLREALGRGVVQPWPAAGRFKRVRCTGNWDSCRISESSDLPTQGCVVGVPSMSAVGRHLIAECQDLAVHVDRTARVLGQDPKTGQWAVEWKREAPTGGQLRYRPELADVPSEVDRASFDAVVLAFEANKILRGCKSGYKMVESSATPTIRRAITGRAKTSQMWNLMVAFDAELPMPWDAASVEGHRSIAWVAVNSSKPQRARTPQCFMVFSTREWADWKQWGKREVERELQEEFLLFLHQVLGRRPPKPSFVLSGRWGNNTETVLTGERAVGEFPMRALGYHEPEAEAVWDAAVRMGATGDWARGYSVSDAYGAGVEMASAILAPPDAAMAG